ncbi:MAG: type B 50S ribosomal protein L31 [Verrucomicrobia bacterium]|nr:type B 50S ribosomal protein L31 [Verrucomicrobiota bacterium]
MRKKEKNIHPAYGEVLYIDSSTGFKFVCASTYQSDEKEVFEGKEYPVCRVSISSASHPAYTGDEKFLDTAGRIEKFAKRYGGGRQEKK